MIKDVIILGSTGSIGSSSLLSIKNNRNYKIKLLSTKKNINKIFKQAIQFGVKNVVIEDENYFKKYNKIFKKKNINLHLGIKNINKIIRKKVSYCISSISGIQGLEPTLKAIPLTDNILVANKESIICG